jgi:hypothetical protein
MEDLRMNEELLPCPMCKGRATYWEPNNLSEIFRKKRTVFYGIVQCTNCSLESPPLSPKEVDQLFKEYVFKKWNDRK